MEIEQLHEWITHYFNQNATHQEIISLLLKNHRKKISHSTLKKHLQILELRRKNIEESDIRDICRAIAVELYSSCGCNLGYRALWQKLKLSHGLNVKRETVYSLLKIADPEGIARRRASVLKRRDYIGHGPNWIWHIDGYDKLKHYGFCIHGAIDGFSRYVKWLRTATTNNNPRIAARYFLESVRETGGVPTLIRVDAGTENVNIGTLQVSIRELHEDSFAGGRSFISGRSVHNQRIEAFWGQVRKHSMDYYIDFFKTMKEEGLFNGRREEMECLQFCFGPLIQHDLDETRELWNKHQIRKQRDKVNHGKPYSMYHLPENYGTEDYRKPVSLETVDALMDRFTEEPHIYEPAFAQRAYAALPDLSTPTTSIDALNLYCRLKCTMGI